MTQNDDVRSLTTARLRTALRRAGLALRVFRGARRGAIGVALSLLFVPVVMVVGAAVDYARLEQFKTQLQATVDSAALSGAAAYADSTQNTNAITVATNYVTSNQALLPSHIGSITSSISATQVATGSNQGYTVSVSATATIGTTFMRLITPSMNVSASATAVNPLVQITISASHFSANAGDGNTLWYWLLSSANPSAAPDPSQFAAGQKLASNMTTNNRTVTFVATATQKLGMALQNVTGQNADYGCTQYQTVPYTLQYVSNGWRGGSWQQVAQSCAGTTQWFFSNVMPPNNNTYNEIGYRNETLNCSVQTTLSTSLPGNTVAPVSGSCFNSLPTYATPSCAQMNGEFVNFWWNDMGGTTDDKDYNDAEISIQCSGISGSGNSATGVYLSS